MAAREGLLHWRLASKWLSDVQPAPEQGPLRFLILLQEAQLVAVASHESPTHGFILELISLWGNGRE
jgi:hypothetical protein